MKTPIPKPKYLTPWSFALDVMRLWLRGRLFAMEIYYTGLTPRWEHIKQFLQEARDE